MIAQLQETGEAYAKMGEVIKSQIEDVEMLVQTAIEGNLATRADASKHQGEFRKIVQGMNDTLDAVTGPMQMAAKCLDSIAKGDIPPKITDPYQGDFNEIKNNLNTCIDAVDALIADATLLSQAAVEGKLSTRADASKHQGDFRKIVQGMNDTLDAITAPMRIAAQYIEDFGQGTVMPRINASYNGDFNEIINNLNQYVDTRNKIVQLIYKIAKGDLTTIVRPRSEKDEMANALAQMLANLRQLTGQMQEATDNISKANSNISAATAEQAATVTEQASSVAETTTAVEEVRQTAKQSVERVQLVSEMASNTLKLAETGLDAMKRTEDGMLDLKEQVRHIAETILNLSEQTLQIGEIISTVNDIADQSNLLALNAAMEAARVGEAGRGFAVLAGEVRNLAEQSRQATTQVTSILSEIQKAANAAVLVTEQGTKSAESGVELAQSTGNSIRTIREHTQQVVSASEQIAASARQQLAGMDQITRAMENINQGATQTQKGMQQVDRAAQNLNDLGNQLTGIVQRYKIG
jgi:methyl-accepting chemotaxis protein